jgi:hypothetical protein
VPRSLVHPRLPDAEDGGDLLNRQQGIYGHGGGSSLPEACTLLTSSVKGGGTLACSARPQPGQGVLGTGRRIIVVTEGAEVGGP